MANTFSYLYLTKQILASSLLITVSTLTTIVKAEALKPSAVKQPESTLQTTIANKLLGQWQTREPASGQTVKFIFTPKGKLFFLIPSSSGRLVALEMTYKTNTRTQPMQIDLTTSNNETALTIFEITPLGKLKIELTGVKPNQPRPTNFTSKASLFEKVSDLATIPKDVQLLRVERADDKPKQNVAIQYINILNKAQQDYFQQKGKFANTMEELGIVTSSETEFYRYQILPQKERNQSAIITAQAKSSTIPSYTGVVFNSKINGKSIKVTGICASDRPSTKPPMLPKLSISNPQQVQCPQGSHLFK